jgi:ABC-type phosphate/phosphonate transport system ATPase subunit
LIDEPITDLNEKDTAISINILRNLVNNDYNVVVTLDTPSPTVFKSIDTCLLLRKGSKVYLGKAENAVDYFTSAPFKVNL